MVTIESLTKVGRYSWKVVYSSDLPEPVFYIYLDGNLIAETANTEYELAVNMDEGSVIEVLDDADAQPIQIFPGKVRLGWFFAEGTDYYRIDEYVDSAWIERKRMPDNGGYMSWQSRFLEDGQTHIFRITPVGTNGNEGTERQFAVLMCRRPDVPDVGYAYNEGAGKVTIHASDEPPSELIIHCAAHYKMNDNEGNTTVMDSMENSDGTAQRNTSLMHAVGKVGSGALNYNGTNDYVDIGMHQKIIRKDFSINVWIKPAYNGIGNFIISAHQGTGPSFCEVSIWSTGETEEGAQDIGVSAEIGMTSATVQTEGGMIPFDEWTMVTMVVKQIGASVFTYLYINGELYDSYGAAFQLADFVLETTFAIGAYHQDAEPYYSNFYEGVIDELPIFDKALTAAEVAYLYNNGDGREDF